MFHTAERMTRSAVRAFVSAAPTETISSAMKQGRLGSGLSIFRMMQKKGLSSTPTAYGITVMRSSRLLFLHTELVKQPVLSLEHQNESNRRNLGFERNHPWEDFLADWLYKLPATLLKGVHR